MIVYAKESALFLVIPLIILCFSIHSFYIRDKKQLAVGLLILAAFIFRVTVAAFDPFLHDWDERFHALVAKNMIDFPFKPMLHRNAIFEYTISDWCCNHIWVHKQPLFLWQMAMSMKIFGVNVFALRLPSIIMGSITVYLIYDIANKWTRDIHVSYLASLLFACSYYNIELISGRISLEHNDVAFAFYITAGIWAFVNYISTDKKIKWAIICGVFVGCAILVKWLTAILIFGGWGLYILLENWKQVRSWLHLVLALLFAMLIAMPWQLYIANRFPQETAAMHLSNITHLKEDLGHPGTMMFHFDQLDYLYGHNLVFFIPIGLVLILLSRDINRKLSISCIAMVMVIYLFFTVLVKTKMTAFPYPVSGLMWILIAVGIAGVKDFIIEKISRRTHANLITIGVLFLLAVYTLKPWQIISYRSSANILREQKIHNTKIYRGLPERLFDGETIIINCKSFEDVEFMFHRDCEAFPWFPEEHVLDSLLNLGYKFAAFESHNNQHLPDYITKNDHIEIIRHKMK